MKNYTPDELMRIVATPLTMGVALGEEFPDGEYIPYPWLRYVERETLAALYRPGNEIIIISIPFQTGKSSFFSYLLPAWYLGRYPGRTWLNISYNDERARAWGRGVRNLLRRYGQPFFGVTVDTEAEAAGEWHFRDSPGGMISSGIRSTVNGVTGHVVALDDTLKSMEEANSPPIKRRNMDEFDTVIMGRFQSNPLAPTKGLIINTRLVEDDIGGELLERASKPGYTGIPVRLINIKAIAEPDPDELASMDEGDLEQWRDVLGRRYGEPLESRHTPEFFAQRKASMPPGMWQAAYQGVPTFGASGMFPELNWRFWVYDDEEADLGAGDIRISRNSEFGKVVRAWDIASSPGGGDFTVGTKVARDHLSRIIVLDRERFQYAPGDVDARVKSVAEADGYEVNILIEKELSGAGQTVVDNYMRTMPGYSVVGVRAEGVKESRATPASIEQNKNNCYLPRNAWWVQEWIKEHSQMDGKGKRPKHDDQIDTFAYAVRFLVSSGDSHIFDISSISADRDDLSMDEKLHIMAVRQALGLG